MKPCAAKRFEPILMILLGVPVLGVLMGGIYWIPAMRVTRERDPWLTLLLAGALAITTFAAGLSMHASPFHLALVWIVSVALLLVKRSIDGSLGDNLERFGIVHVFTLFSTVCVGALSNVLRHPR